MIALCRELKGSILDIGGGGEGVIGRLYARQVVAIDNCQAELDEAPEGFEKLLMDATCLTFPDASFDHVTAFYALMFMRAQEQRLAVLEAARVLRPGGTLHIWDCDILSAFPEPFCINVEIQLPGERIAAAYGIGKQDAQSRQSILRLCTDTGLALAEERTGEDGFYLRLQKKER